ncbi:multimerin-2-like isoform X2 [Saccostrea cucullata]|uniref:multimerin-2-like isoform X2 n=1 Tax=Saccostrea cuccullata TaxID=36930 RepID=UPI002ED52CD0
MMHIAILCFLVLSCRYEVHSLLSTHGNDVEQLKQLVQQMNISLQHVLAENQKLNVQQLQMNVSLQHVLAENQKLNAEINGLKNLTSQVAASSTGLHPVVFTAILSQNVELGAGQTVVFNKTLLNVGNAYHETYGHFRAPVSGLYQFSVSLLNNKKETKFEIVRNGNQNLAKLYTQAGTYSASAKTIAVRLELDDVLFVRTITAGNLDGSAYYCVFSGFLIHKQ